MFACFGKVWDLKLLEVTKVQDQRRIHILIILNYVLLVALIVIAAVLGIRLAVMRILPWVFMAAYSAVCVIFALVLWLVRRKKVPSIIFMILAVFLAAVMLYALAAVNKVDQTVDKVTTLTETEITQVSVLVLDCDTAENISDLRGYSIGYSSDCSDQIVAHVMAEIADQGGGENDCTVCGGVLQTAQALLSGEVDAVFLNAAYIEMIDELEEYTGFSDEVRVLDTLNIEEEKPAEPSASEPEQTESKAEVSAGKDTFIVYISGIDTYGDVGTKSRSDVNILAAVNTSTHQVQLINTPRDYYVPLPNSNGTPDKLTHAGIYGIETSIGALEMLYDIEIDYYVRMNFTGFEDIIDTMGGIDVYSERDFTVEPVKHYTVGINHLSGVEALAFARERHAFAAGDIQRGINQMAVVTAMIDKLTSAEVLYNYSAVLDSISGSFQTNFTSDEIYALVRQQLQNGGSWDIQSMTVTGTGDSRTTFSMPGTTAYVMLPDESEVVAAQEKIAAVLSAE